MNHPSLRLEPDEIETVADVIKQLAYHRQTHTEWAEHFEEYPKDARSEPLGDAIFHRKVEARYTKMIEVLESTDEDKQVQSDE